MYNVVNLIDFTRHSRMLRPS